MPASADHRLNESIYGRLGVRTIINASGPSTRLSGGIMLPEVAQAMAEAIERASAYSIAGCGDTLAAIDQFGVTDAISYISTGGGAFLEFVEGKTLPAVAALEEVSRG